MSEVISCQGSLKIVHGIVPKDADGYEGNGWVASKESTGKFRVTFVDNCAFKETPTVVLQVMSDQAREDETRINAVLRKDGLSGREFRAVTGDDDGDLKSKQFSFIAIGY